MNDLEIQSLYEKLINFIKVDRPYTLRIRRRPFLKFMTSGYTNDQKKQIELDINNTFEQSLRMDDCVSLILIHELLHIKYPEKSDFELFIVEGHPDLKIFRRFFGREPPVSEEDIGWDVKEEEEWARKIGLG